MFIVLLIITFLISLLVCFIVARIFNKPIQGILNRLIEDNISGAWLTFLKFAIYVVGISAGVGIWQLERYITPTASKGNNIRFF